MSVKNELLENMNKIHTTELGAERIKRRKNINLYSHINHIMVIKCYKKKSNYSYGICICCIYRKKDDLRMKKLAETGGK